MCYLVVFHITLFVMAILCFVKGKLQISHRWVAKGAPAYLAAVVLLLPLPLTLLILFFVGLAINVQGQFLLNPQELERWTDQHGFAFVLLTLGITTACVSGAFLIAMVGARDPEEIAREERAERRGWDDEEWDR